MSTIVNISNLFVRLKKEEEGINNLNKAEILLF